MRLLVDTTAQCSLDTHNLTRVCLPLTVTQWPRLIQFSVTLSVGSIVKEVDLSSVIYKRTTPSVDIQRNLSRTVLCKMIYTCLKFLNDGFQSNSHRNIMQILTYIQSHFVVRNNNAKLKMLFTILPQNKKGKTCLHHLRYCVVQAYQPLP